MKIYKTFKSYVGFKEQIYYLERKTVFVLLCFQRYPPPCVHLLQDLYLQSPLVKTKHLV